MKLTRLDIAKIKEDCLYWCNNCGGCETCSQVFAVKPEYDHQETLALILQLEEAEKRVALMQDAIDEIHSNTSRHCECCEFIHETIIELKEKLK